MKICIVGPAFPLRGGIANFNEALARSLMTEGHDVEIISFTLQYPNFLFPGKTQFDETGSPPKNLKIKELVNSINPFSWLKTARYIKASKPDLVIIRFWIPFMGMSLGSIAKLINKRIKVIGLTDNVIPHEKRIGDQILTSYFLKNCHAFMTMSKSVLNDIKSFKVKGEIELSPHPIYDIYGDSVDKKVARNKLNLREEDRLIMFFGLVRGYKGLDLLLKAMVQESVKQSNVKLLIAGEFYDNEEKYRTLINELGIDSHIILVNHYIPNEEVKYYFSAVDLVVQPYKTATQSGITQIGFHFEKPMIVTNVGGLPEIIEHGVDGFVVDTEPKDIAKYISKYFEEGLESEFSQKLKSSKKRFSWEYFTQKLLSLQNKIDLK